MINRMIFVCGIVLLFTQSAKADFSVELFAANVNIVDAENQYGAGGSLIHDYSREFKVIARGIYTYYPGEINLVETDYDVKYEHMSGMLGIEYNPEIGFLTEKKLHWRNSIYFGYSRTEVTIQGIEGCSASDSGPAMALVTGISYDYSNYFQYFAEAGFHKSFYSDVYSNYNIYGFQFFAGVRYALSGSRKIEYGY